MNRKTHMIRHLYRTHFASFVAMAFGVLHPNHVYLDHWMIHILADNLERCRRGEIKRLIVNVPPRYLKSLTVSVAYTAWLLARRPEAKIMCVAGTRGLANVQHAAARDLMTHPRYQAIFPHVQVREKGRGLRSAHGGSRDGFTPAGGMTGRGADVIIIDDPLPASAVGKRNLRQSVNEWYDQNAHQRLDNKTEGVIIVVMQRLHVDDLTGHLLRRDGWELLCLPAIATKDETYPRLFGHRVLRRKGAPLQPGLETREQLMEAMINMGAIPFMAQYQQDPYPPGRGEGRGGLYSSLRKGVEWTPDQGHPVLWLGRMPEERILSHTVFGEGEHPWPDDMRTGMTEREFLAYQNLVEEERKEKGWPTATDPGPP